MSRQRPLREAGWAPMLGLVAGLGALGVSACEDEGLFPVSDPPDAGTFGGRLDAGAPVEHRLRWADVPSTGVVSSSPPGGRYRLRARLGAPVGPVPSDDGQRRLQGPAAGAAHGGGERR